jgi:hypothetical protein
MTEKYNTLEFDYDRIRQIKLKMNKEQKEKEEREQKHINEKERKHKEEREKELKEEQEKKDLESKLNTNTKSQSKIIVPNNKIYTSNSTMDEMVDYFISKGKDYYAKSTKESLELLRKYKGKDVLIMTFAEAVKKFNQTKERCWNTTDDVYFKIKVFYSGMKLVHLAGTGVSMPKNYDEALKIYAGLKKQKYNGKPIEVLVGDDINTKNATQHTFAVIIDDILEKSDYYETKVWCNNTFVKFMNGGKSGLKELAKEYGYDKFGSFYKFKKTDNKKFEVGCSAHIYYLDTVLFANHPNYYGQFRG